MHNPEKRITANYPIEKIKEALKELPKHTDAVILSRPYDMMGYYIFDTTGKNSFKDMIVEISLHRIDESNTDIIIVYRGKEKWENNPLLMTPMYNFINGTISVLSKLLSGELK